MATLLRPNEKPRAVKNLGWLLRHWQDVEYIGFNYWPSDKRVNDGELIAKLKDGSTYLTDFASLTVAWNWLDRPVFRGLTFKFVRLDVAEGKRTSWIIGNDEWKRINRLSWAEQQAAILSAAI